MYPPPTLEAPTNSPKLASFQWLNRTLILYGTSSMLTLKFVGPGGSVRDVAVFGRGNDGQLQAGWLLDPPPTSLHTTQLFRTGATIRAQATADHLFNGDAIDPELGIELLCPAPELSSKDVFPSCSREDA